MDYAAHRAKLAPLFEKVDTVAIVPGANMVYFTGMHFHLSERPTIAMFKKNGDVSFIIPQLEVTQLSKQPDLAQARTFSWSDTDGYEGAFMEAVQSLGLENATLGIDDKTMRMFEGMEFQRVAPNMKLAQVGTDLLNIRALKSQEEVELMRKAIEISEKGLDALIPQLKAGMTEREIAGKLDALLMDFGTQGFAFRALVQSGENSAFPHGSVSDRTLKEGDFLLIDFGGMYSEYPADITRTFVFGEPSDKMRDIYEAVRAANQAAIEAVRPGVTCGDIDKAARDVIKTAGFGEYFTHRTGHGLGLQGHELPQIAENVSQPLEAGMVFTIEPGVYVPGVGGVRIEDNVVVTENGVDVLTRYPRNLRIIS